MDTTCQSDDVLDLRASAECITLTKGQSLACVMSAHCFGRQEVRKSGTYKSQLEMYKCQVQELQMKIGDETKRADKAEFDCKRVQEKMAAVQREKEVRPAGKCWLCWGKLTSHVSRLAGGASVFWRF